MGFGKKKDDTEKKWFGKKVPGRKLGAFPKACSGQGRGVLGVVSWRLGESAVKASKQKKTIAVTGSAVGKGKDMSMPKGVGIMGGGLPHALGKGRGMKKRRPKGVEAREAKSKKPAAKKDGIASGLVASRSVRPRGEKRGVLEIGPRGEALN